MIIHPMPIYAPDIWPGMVMKPLRMLWFCGPRGIARRLLNKNFLYQKEIGVPCKNLLHVCATKTLQLQNLWTFGWASICQIRDSSRCYSGRSLSALRVQGN